MIQIAQANCQSPPIVDGSGKPAGGNIQPGDSETEFKEVLRKEKSKEEEVNTNSAAAVLAGNYKTALPLNEPQPLQSFPEGLLDDLQSVDQVMEQTDPVQKASGDQVSGEAVMVLASDIAKTDVVNLDETASIQGSPDPSRITSVSTGQGQQIQQTFNQPENMKLQVEASHQALAPTSTEMPVNDSSELRKPSITMPSSGDTVKQMSEPAIPVEYQSGTAIHIEYEAAAPSEVSVEPGKDGIPTQTGISAAEDQKQVGSNPGETQSRQPISVKESAGWTTSPEGKTGSSDPAIITEPAMDNSATARPSSVGFQRENSGEYGEKIEVSTDDLSVKPEQYQTTGKSSEKGNDTNHPVTSVEAQSKPSTKVEPLEMGLGDVKNIHDSTTFAQEKITSEAFNGLDTTESLIRMNALESDPEPAVYQTTENDLPVSATKTSDLPVEGEDAQTVERVMAQVSELAGQERAHSQNEMGKMTSEEPDLNIKAEMAASGSEELKRSSQQSVFSNSSGDQIEANTFSEKLNTTGATGSAQGEGKPNSATASDLPLREIKGGDAAQFSVQEDGKVIQTTYTNTQEPKSNSKEEAIAPIQQGKVQSMADNVEPGVMSAEVFASSMKQGISLHSSMENPSEMSGAHIQQIVNEVNQTLQAGKTVVRIQLQPENMGKIDIRLSSDASGLGVTIMAEHASTRRLLESQTDILRQSLENAGLHLSHMNFGMKGQEGQSERPFYQNDQSQTSRNWFQKPWRESETGKYTEAPQRMTLQSTSIDYRI